jgi:putative Ca2+/H+ antiporter (TMEM165/GDT1 family)
VWKKTIVKRSRSSVAVNKYALFMEVGASNCESLNAVCALTIKPMVEGSKEKAQAEPPLESKELGFVAVMATTFTTVFLAEMGDKTQIATLLLSAQSGQTWLVFLGAALALIASSLVGVLVGRALANILPPDRLQKMAGTLMVALGLWLGLQATQSLIASSQTS